MSLFNLIFRRRKIENPASFSINNIKKFLQGNYYKFAMSIPSLRKKIVKKTRLEQYYYRKTQVSIKAPACLATGECYCGCDIEGLLLADPGCEQKGQCFPPMMDAHAWRKFKEEHNIVI